MSEWEGVSKSDEWYTPPEIFRSLNIEFDLDVAAPYQGVDYVPCKKRITQLEDGLKAKWEGKVWMNPPFGGRNGQVPWLEKFIKHGNGIGLVPARTSAKWFHELIPKMEAILFPKGKTKFIKPNGEVGKTPGTGIIIFAIGKSNVDMLSKSNLGMFFRL